MIKCKGCNYCKYPKSGGGAKCKLMRYKPIGVAVSSGETPTWCPLKEFEKGNSKEK
ncbi:MAG: hypothetical protein ACI4MN_05925 [Candidatus Coproplasma sp.]